MKKVRLALAVAVVAFFAVLAPSPAQAYPPPTCTITNPGDVTGGEDVTVTVTVGGLNPADPTDFEVTYQDQVHNATGVTETTATFETPEVDDETETVVFAKVTQGELPDNSAPCTATITLQPDDDDDDSDGDGDGGGILPNTGGERLAWLVIGAMLVLVGGGVVLASRRRDA